MGYKFGTNSLNMFNYSSMIGNKFGYYAGAKYLKWPYNTVQYNKYGMSELPCFGNRAPSLKHHRPNHNPP